MKNEDRQELENEMPIQHIESGEWFYVVECGDEAVGPWKVVGMDQCDERELRLKDLEHYRLPEGLEWLVGSYVALTTRWGSTLNGLVQDVQNDRIEVVGEVVTWPKSLKLDEEYMAFDQIERIEGAQRPHGQAFSRAIART